MREIQHQWVVEPHEPGAWTDRKEQRRGHVFRASWSDTVALMDRELVAIGAAGRVVLQLDLKRGRIRRDGFPGADVVTEFPGVAVSFDSDRGPLTYRVDTFEADGRQGLSGWQANFRAVALTLGALRAVARFGGAELGQQYTGWLQLTRGSGGPFTSTEEAQRWLLRAAQEHGITNWDGGWSGVVRRMLAKLHQDTSELPAAVREPEWERLMAARKILNL